MRLVFAGTPRRRGPVARRDRGVPARPGRRRHPAGRPRRTRPPGDALARSARWADEHGVPVLQPVKPSQPDFLEALADLEPDCCPVVAYGALVPKSALDVPPARLGQPALLAAARLARRRARAARPHGRRRGHRRDDVPPRAGPRHRAGASASSPRRSGPRDTAGDLLDRLASAGAGLLVATLDAIADGTAVPVPQPAEGVSLAPKVTVEEARVDWSLPGHVIDRRIRGCTPAPGAWTTFRGERLKIGPLRARSAPAGSTTGPGRRARPGELPATGGTSSCSARSSRRASG